MDQPIARVLDLVPDASQHLYDLGAEQAREILRTEQAERVLDLHGSFALTARVEERVVMARSLDRPLRYFLAKETSGPMLVVAERIDQIRAQLVELGYGAMFHPS
jgi:asparagine synthase (glutamine-hydrolysing)